MGQSIKLHKYVVPRRWPNGTHAPARPSCSCGWPLGLCRWEFARAHGVPTCPQVEVKDVLEDSVVLEQIISLRPPSPSETCVNRSLPNEQDTHIHTDRVYPTRAGHSRLTTSPPQGSPIHFASGITWRALAPAQAPCRLAPPSLTEALAGLCERGPAASEKRCNA